MENSTSTRVAVAGGTGTVGRHVLQSLADRGIETVVLTRSSGVDLLTGAGLTGVLAGVSAVVDVTSVASTSSARSRDFFGTVTRTLLEAGRAAGVRHHVALSIVGIDRGRTGHYAGKLVQERLVEDGPVPWTILRATQFHEFAAQMHQALRVGPVHLAPRMRSQPVAAAEVGRRLAELALGDPAGRVRELAGPREESMLAMVRAYDRATGGRGRVVGVPLPGPLGRAMRRGDLLPGPEAELGTETFDQWLRRTSGRD